MFSMEKTSSQQNVNQCHYIHAKLINKLANNIVANVANFQGKLSARQWQSKALNWSTMHQSIAKKKAYCDDQTLGFNVNDNHEHLQRCCNNYKIKINNNNNNHSVNDTNWRQKGSQPKGSNHKANPWLSWIIAAAAASFIVCI